MSKFSAAIAAVLFSMVAGIVPLLAQADLTPPTGQQLLELIDANMVAATQSSTFSMTIQTRRGSRTIRARSWADENDNSFTEFLAPPREQGVKMLKLEDQLWTYHPGTDRVIRIAGHLLRQSVMGSDLSYEDLLDNRELLQFYDASVIAVDTVAERNCWVLELLTREGMETAYHTRKLWVDQEQFLPLMEERYGRSGRLLKKTGITEVIHIDNRWYPRRMYFRDMLKKGDGTEIVIEEIEFDIVIPPHLFTRAGLRK